MSYQIIRNKKQYNENKHHTKQVNGRDKQPEKEPDNKKAYD